MRLLSNLKICFCFFAIFLLFFTISCTGGGDRVNVKPFRFAYLADLHVSDVAANVEDLEFSIADIVAQDSLDFVIFAGDITEFGSDEEIGLAKSIMDRLDIPYYILSGNHDSKWSESGCNTFIEVFGYEVFHFEHNGVHFIGTNSGPNMRMMPALVPREAMVWLDSVTREIPRQAPVIFVNHYPLDDAMLNHGEVLDLLRRTNIQLAMCGHGHNNVVLDYDGVRGVMGRSNLRGGKVAAGKAGYNIVSVAGDSLWMNVRAGGVTEAEPWFGVRLLGWRENAAGAEAGRSAAGAAGAAATAAAADERSESARASVAAGEGDSASAVAQVWEFQDNSDIGSAPAYAFGNVYISNTAGVIKALDGGSGEVVWSYATGGKVFSSPAVDSVSGVLVVGSSDNSIYGLDARSGELRWRVVTGKSVLGSPYIYKGVAFIGGSDNVFRAVDVASGELVWKFEGVRSFVESRPWVDESGVYFGDWGNRVYALDVRSGELRWEWSNSRGRGLSAAAVWPVKVGSHLFVVTPERRVHAIDASSGRELWWHRGGREAIGLSEDGSALYIKTMQDTVIAFDAVKFIRGGVGSPASGRVDEFLGGGSSASSSGSFSLTAAPGARWPGRAGSPVVLWQSHTGYGYEIAPSPITSAYGLVFIPTDKGDIFALNAVDGSVAWSYRFSIALINYVLPIGNGELLVTSMDGKVARLRVGRS